ncbi:hypothetical protein ABZY34_27975 [Streptomyces virginiae]|uniref:DUF7373 family lipoprotein n=1 Tax=Streptomyces virginiae TaxID=1961 RepID=UPI0033A2F629
MQEVKAVVRGTVCVVALVVALTGCGGEGNTAVGGIGSGDGKGKTSGALSAEQVRSALPTNESLGEIFVGNDAVVGEGEQARQHCAEQTGTTCNGMVAVGHKEAAVRGKASGDEVEFTLFSFDSPQAASAAAKGLAAKIRGREPAPEPTQIAAGADETEGFTNGRKRTDVVMRVGNVLAYVLASTSNSDNVKQVATQQVDLIKKAARQP